MKTRIIVNKTNRRVLQQTSGFEVIIKSFSKRYGLTKRESEILLLIASLGLTNREIADRCCITEKTVKNHIANSMNKIGIGSMRKLLSLLMNDMLVFDECKLLN